MVRGPWEGLWSRGCFALSLILDFEAGFFVIPLSEAFIERLLRAWPGEDAEAVRFVPFGICLIRSAEPRIAVRNLLA